MTTITMKQPTGPTVLTTVLITIVGMMDVTTMMTDM